MIADRKDKKNLISLMKNALLVGLLFSIVVTSAWFFFESVGTRMLAFVILSTSVVILILKLLFNLVMDRIKCSNMKLADDCLLYLQFLHLLRQQLVRLAQHFCFCRTQTKKRISRFLKSSRQRSLRLNPNMAHLPAGLYTIQKRMHHLCCILVETARMLREGSNG